MYYTLLLFKVTLILLGGKRVFLRHKNAMYMDQKLKIASLFWIPKQPKLQFKKRGRRVQGSLCRQKFGI